MLVTSDAPSTDSVSGPAIADRRFPCRVGLNRAGLWVRSPKTGKIIEIGSQFIHWLRERAPRVVGKIAKAASCGLHFVELTIAELMAIAEIAKLANAELTVPPRSAGLWNGWRAPLGRRGRRLLLRKW